MAAKMTCVVCGKMHNAKNSSFASIICNNQIGRYEEHIYHLCPKCAGKVHDCIQELIVGHRQGGPREMDYNPLECDT